MDKPAFEDMHRHSSKEFEWDEKWNRQRTPKTEQEKRDVLFAEGVGMMLHPNMRSYEYMVRALARAGYLHSAVNYLRRMRDKNWVPNKRVVSLLKSRLSKHPTLVEEVERLTVPLVRRLDRQTVVGIHRMNLALRRKPKTLHQRLK